MALNLTDAQTAELEKIRTDALKENEKIEPEIEKTDGEKKDALILELQQRTDEADEKIAKLLGFLNEPEGQKLPAPIDPTQNGDPTWGYSKGVPGKDHRSEYLLDIVKWSQGERPERLVKIKKAMEEKAAGAGLQENFDSEGGFLVFPEYSTEMLTVGLEKAMLLSRVRNMPMSSNTLKLNFIADTDRSSGTVHGGVRMYYTAEESETTATKPALGQFTLSLNKLFGLAYATSELLEDSVISLGPWLTEAFGDAFSWQMDYDIINGSGTGKPEGILNASCLEAVTIETNQTNASGLVPDNIFKMYARMPGYNRQNAVWLMNEELFPQVAGMTLVGGTASTPVYLPANGLANQPFDTLMGKEVIMTEHCQAAGTTGDLIFSDLTQVIMGSKANGSLRTDTSIHVKFLTDETAFRFIYRVDLKCWWPSSVTPRHGSNALSPIVTLATRS